MEFRSKKKPLFCLLGGEECGAQGLSPRKPGQILASLISDSQGMVYQAPWGQEISQSNFGFLQAKIGAMGFGLDAKHGNALVSGIPPGWCRCQPKGSKTQCSAVTANFFQILPHQVRRKRQYKPIPIMDCPYLRERAGFRVLLDQV